MKKEPNFVDKHVGSRVRMRRMLVGMSQEKLGEALGITFQQVQKYEKGTNRISASRLQQIASVLGVTISFFYEGLPAEVEGGGFAEESSPAFVMDFMASQDGLQLMQNFMRIRNPRIRRSIVDHVRALAEDDESRSV
jgi:transcriptional regulator with XRE-family HTH domain